jgi:hypothetical protein
VMYSRYLLLHVDHLVQFWWWLPSSITCADCGGGVVSVSSSSVDREKMVQCFYLLRHKRHLPFFNRFDLSWCYLLDYWCTNKMPIGPIANYLWYNEACLKMREWY